MIGAGSWGTTVANLLAQKGLDVTLCPREADLASCIARSHENSRYLPGVALSPRLNVAVTPADVVPDTDLLVFAIPAQSLREVVRRLRDCVTDRTILLNVAKGIEEGTGSRCSEIILDELKRANPMAVLSGPNIAWEVALGVPSKAVVSCSNYRYLAALRDAFSTQFTDRQREQMTRNLANEVFEGALGDSLSTNRPHPRGGRSPGREDSRHPRPPPAAPPLRRASESPTA